MKDVITIEGTVVVQKVRDKYQYVVIYVRRGKEKLAKYNGAMVSGLLVVEDKEQ